MNPIVKKLIAVLLLVPVVAAQAQDWKPTKQNLDRAATANRFANTLIQAALPPGKSAGDSQLSYIADENHWVCHISITGSNFSVDAVDAVPERACVQAILKLAHEGAI